MTQPRTIKHGGYEIDAAKISAVGPVEIDTRDTPTFIVIVDSNQIRFAWPRNRVEVNGEEEMNSEWEARVVEQRELLVKEWKK